MTEIRPEANVTTPDPSSGYKCSTSHYEDIDFSYTNIQHANFLLLWVVMLGFNGLYYNPYM